MNGEPGKDIVVLAGAGFARSLGGLHGLPEPRRREPVSSTTRADGPVIHTYAAEEH